MFDISNICYTLLSMKLQVLIFTMLFSTYSQAVELERTIFLMGSNLKMVLSGKAESQLIKASEQIVQELNQFEKNISTWQPTSEFSRFNLATPGTPFLFSKKIKATLDSANYCYGLTGGFFHPGLGKLIEAWGLRKTGAVPDADELIKIHQSSNFSHLKKSAQTYSKTEADFFLEEGGFAKGAALDLASKIAKKFSIKNYYFNFSGQILTQSKQFIKIAHPDHRTEASIGLPLEHSSLSTSANTVQKFNVAGKKFGHIIDPFTGSPVPLFHRSVSVMAQSATMADCLSTGLLIMSEKPEIFLKWIRNHPQYSVVEVSVEKNNLRVNASCKLKNKIKKIHPNVSINYLCN